MRLRLRLLETVVEVRADDPAAARLLTLLWAAMQTGDDAPPVRTYEVRRDGHAWVAAAGDELEAVHETLWGVTDALRYQMIELCEERSTAFVTVHAAAVARADELVLLAGGSGAGKTTLTLALLETGWSYLSDDLAPVAVETGLVHPFPKPLGVKDPALWTSVRRAFPGLDGVEPPAGPFLVPPSPWGAATKPLAPRAIFFSRFEPGAQLEVEEVSAAKGAALASEYLRRLDPARLALLKGLCSGAACFRLRYGETAAAVDAIEASPGLLSNSA